MKIGISNKDEWESHYDQAIPLQDFAAFDKIDSSAPFIRRLLKYGEGKKRSLEFGSGKGGISLALKQSFPNIETHLLDFSGSAVEFSRQLFSHFQKEGHFHQGSFLKLPFEDNHFDFIFGHTVLEHVRETEKAVEELMRVLAPGGIALITVPNRFRRYDGHDIYHIVHNLKYFSKTFFQAELKDLFLRNSCEVVGQFGEGFIFFYPSYIPLLFYRFGKQILRRHVRGNSTLGFKNEEKIAESKTLNENMVEIDRKMSHIYSLSRFPFEILRVLDKLWSPIQSFLNKKISNHGILPTPFFITIGIVVRKQK